MKVVQSARARHLSLVPSDRRARRREQRRRRILDAADALIVEHGLDGITMQRVADHLDCAVGTLYLYFRSKAALVAALQARAVRALRRSWDTAQETWAPVLGAPSLDSDIRALVGLCAFGAHWVAVSVVLADEFHLQRRLLTEPVVAGSGPGSAEVLAVVDDLLAVPRALIAAGHDTGALSAGGDPDERALVWVAGLNGILLVDRISSLDLHRFRVPHLARLLTEDLLCGWGAGREHVEVADVHVQRLAALGPLAPAPSAPDGGE